MSHRDNIAESLARGVAIVTDAVDAGATAELDHQDIASESYSAVWELLCQGAMPAEGGGLADDAPHDARSPRGAPSSAAESAPHSMGAP
eukprot:8970331-Pyramimonas_sp.AAC.1